MLYLSVSQFAAVEQASRVHVVNQFGWHDAVARPRKYVSLWSLLRRGEPARWNLRAGYSFGPLETASV